MVEANMDLSGPPKRPPIQPMLVPLASMEGTTPTHEDYGSEGGEDFTGTVNVQQDVSDHQ